MTPLLCFREIPFVQMLWSVNTLFLDVYKLCLTLDLQALSTSQLSVVSYPCRAHSHNLNHHDPPATPDAASQCQRADTNVSSTFAQGFEDSVRSQTKPESRKYEHTPEDAPRPRRRTSTLTSRTNSMTALSNGIDKGTPQTPQSIPVKTASTSEVSTEPWYRYDVALFHLEIFVAYSDVVVPRSWSNVGGPGPMPMSYDVGT